MNPSTPKKILDFCLEAGADFAEIYEEETRKSHLAFKDNAIEGASASIIYGIGIRMLYGTEVLYGFTSDDSEEVLMNIARNLSLSKNKRGEANFQFGKEDSYVSYIKDSFKDPRKFGQQYKKDFLFAANSAARIDSKFCR